MLRKKKSDKLEANQKKDLPKLLPYKNAVLGSFPKETSGCEDDYMRAKKIAQRLINK